MSDLQITVEHWLHQAGVYQDRLVRGDTVVSTCLIRHRTPEAAKRCGGKRLRWRGTRYVSRDAVRYSK